MILFAIFYVFACLLIFTLSLSIYHLSYLNGRTRAEPLCLTGNSNLLSYLSFLPIADNKSESLDKTFHHRLF